MGDLIDEVGKEFETHMNSDLAVGAGFDRISQLLEKIDGMREGGSLSPKNAGKLKETLERIDSVWAFIF
jgi:hypothetical protein